MAQLKSLIVNGSSRFLNKTYLNDSINSAVSTDLYLSGNQGKAIINSSANAGNYVMLAKMNSANGYFTQGSYQNKYLLQYTSKASVDAGANSISKSVTLLDETGNTVFPGSITASNFVGSLSGNSLSANKLSTARNIGNASFDGTSSITLTQMGASAIGHTHNYAGSTSVGGIANSAAKLATPRTVTANGDFIGIYSIDGSTNISYDLYNYYGKHLVDNTNNYSYHRIAKLDTITSSYADRASTLYITQDFNGGGYGIARVSLRTNSSPAVSSVEVQWLVRKGLTADCLQAGIFNVYGSTYADLFIKTSGAYASTIVRAVASGGRAYIRRTWILTNSSEVNNTTTSDKKTSTECWKTISEAATELHGKAYSEIITANDAGVVHSANKLTSSRKIGSASFDGTGDITLAQIGAAASSHTHSYVPLSGGTMTGLLNFKIGSRTDTPLRIYSGDANGNALVMQAGGLTILGGGESAVNLYNKLLTENVVAGTERAYVAADDSVYLVSGCQTIANRKTAVFDTSGKFTAPGGFSGALNPNDLSSAVPISKGGTGKTTAADARAALGAAASSHTHAASQVTAGNLPVGVKATNGTDYTTSRIRNIRFGTSVPTSLANGEIFIVYE